MRYDYDMLSNRLSQISVDAGTRWMLNDAMGKLLLAWDSRSHRFRHQYDALHRPIHLHVRTGEYPEFLAERTVYGEGQPGDLALNLRGKPFRQFDGAGIVTYERHDFKGNLLRSTRQLLEDYKQDVKLGAVAGTRAGGLRGGNHLRRAQPAHHTYQSRC